MKKSVVFLIHVVFWLVVLGLFFSNRLLDKYLFNPKQPSNLINILGYIGLFYPLFFYFGYFVLVRLLKNKSYAIYSIVAVIIFLFILFLISREIFAFAIYILGGLFLWGTIGSLFNILLDWFRKRDKIQELEKQNAESNLALLRTQINPHFLFNTLHNIDTLIIDDKENASKALIKLSDIMRYMLNESQNDFVFLEKEIDYINNYISLEKLRIKNPDFIKYAIVGDPKDIRVAPMLFLPFIENAFKHSIDTDSENGIILEITINKKIIALTCENKYDNTYNDKDITHGIGLDTVKRRLDLIYPGKHHLRIYKNDLSYKAELQIELNDN